MAKLKRSEREAVRRQLVGETEEEGRKLFGSELFGSDRFWFGLEFLTLLGHVLLPKRKEIQALAHRHRDQPARFGQALDRTLARRYRKLLRTHNGRSLLQRSVGLGAALFGETRGDSLKVAPDVSTRQLRTFQDLKPFVRAALLGERVAIDEKHFWGLVPKLGAKRPGPRPFPATLRILELHRQAKDRGHRMSDGQIALEAFPEYKNADKYDRQRYRERVRLVRRGE